MGRCFVCQICIAEEEIRCEICQDISSVVKDSKQLETLKTEPE